MSNLQLLEANLTNGLWRRLRRSWEGQLKRQKAPPDWEMPHLEHTERIVAEDGQDDRYKIYVACGFRGGKPAAPYYGFIHINFKVTGTAKPEIRLTTNRLAPKFGYHDLRIEAANVQATFIAGALELSSNIKGKPPIKMFLGNPLDHEFANSFALIAGRILGSKLEAQRRGSWLHVKWL